MLQASVKMQLMQASKSKLKLKPEAYYSLFMQGFSNKEAAEKLKVHKSSVSRMRKKYGAECNRKSTNQTLKIAAQEAIVSKIASYEIEQQESISPDILRQEVLLSEHRRIKTIDRLKIELENCIEQGNYEGVVAISKAIKNLGEPMTSIKGF
jgi:predicted transcriptional regulator